MNLPPLAPVPPVNIQKDLLPEEWEICMDSWILLAQSYLFTPTEKFVSKVVKDPSLPQFLISYVKNVPTSPFTKAGQLRKRAFLLLHRVFVEVKTIPGALLDWNYWVDLSRVYANSKVLSNLLNEIWVRENMDKNTSMARYKSALIRALEVDHMNPELEELLEKTLVILQSCYSYGQFLMLGSDLIDALSASYVKKPRLQKNVVTVTYVSLMSLTSLERPTVSSLLDHLYSLKPVTPTGDFLLKGLINSTPLMAKMRARLSGQENGRADSLMDSLQKFEKISDGRVKKPIRRKIDKGKGKEAATHNSESSADIHVHKLSLVSQIQDLFPDLGSGFVTKLLDEYDDDTEQITAHLLDDNLPEHLRNADRSEALPRPKHPNDNDLAPDLTPRSTFPNLPARRNIHDDDEFDRLAIDTSKLRLGKDQTSTADTLLASQRPSAQKAAIFSALAAFDSDDDERDDTYDVEDVGGTVDTTNDENAADLKLDVHEEALFNAYSTKPDLFNRDAETRRSQARAALKMETAMTDEAIEGWGIMVGRDPRRLDRMKRKFEFGSGGQQRALEGTAWRAESGTEDSDMGGPTRRGRGGGMRGRGGRGGGEGPSDDKGTQAARQKKDANKASRANHNRRDQRARKMARGGFPG